MVREGVESPLIVEDVTLMSPGKWNGWNYTAEELKKAFQSRDYNSEEIALFLDHPEDPNNAAGSWIGRVKNFKQMADATVKGDLEIFDENTIYKLQVGKAKFGVSPRLLGQENLEEKMFTNIVFDNWSVVSKPAQNTAMINLASHMNFDGLSIKQLNLEKEEDSEESPDKKNTQKRKMKGGKKEMSDKEQVRNEETESGAEEVSTEEKPADEKPAEESSEELSDSDVLSIVSNDMEGFAAFRKEHPSLDMKELATKFKERKNKLNFVENLSENEATSMLRKLLDKVSVSELASKPASKELSSDNLVTQELSKQVEDLKKQIKELSKVEKVPAAKSVKNLSAPKQEGFSMINKGSSEGVQELAQAIFNTRGW